MPVVLTMATIVKVSAAVLVPVLAAASFVILFFHKTNTHMDDVTIHLNRGERGKLETKIEAKASREDLKKSIVREVTLQAQGIKQDVIEQQDVRIKKLGKELKDEQKIQFQRILKEVKQARRDIRSY